MILYPTKTRLALLQAVADGEVVYHPYGSPDHGSWQMANKVTGRMAELEQAGLVRLGADIYDEKPSPMLWELTSTGRSVLATVTA